MSFAAAAGCGGSIGGPVDGEGGGGPGGGDDDDDIPPGGGGDPVCDQVEPIEITQASAPDLLLVVDKSGSMEDDLATGDEKWDVMRDALKAVVAEHALGIQFGLQLYPRDDECEAGRVVAPIAPTSAADVAAALDDVEPEGGTPTHTTLQGALAYYQTVPVNPNGRYALLATDGLPNCGAGGSNDETVEETVAAIQSLAAAGIPVFVLGFGDAVNADPTALQQMAAAGGTGSFYAANSPAELAAALAAIAGQVSVPSCTFNLEDVPADPSKIGVFFDDVPVPLDPSRTDGWDYDAGTNTITFYGDSCDELQSGSVGTVRVDYGCGGPIIE